MAINNALLQIGAQAMANAATHLAIHTALPDATGSNQSAAGRVAAGWAVTNGDAVATNKNFTGGAANGPALYVGFWSAATAGTFYGSAPLSGDQSFNAAGEYTVTSATLDGSAS